MLARVLALFLYALIIVPATGVACILIANMVYARTPEVAAASFSLLIVWEAVTVFALRHQP